MLSPENRLPAKPYAIGRKWLQCEDSRRSALHRPPARGSCPTFSLGECLKPYVTGRWSIRECEDGRQSLAKKSSPYRILTSSSLGRQFGTDKFTCLAIDTVDANTDQRSREQCAIDAAKID